MTGSPIRCHVNRRHPLRSVVVIAVMAVLAGADGPTAIARWARLKKEFLVTRWTCPHGVPRKDVFRRVLMRCSTRRLSSLLRRLVESLRAKAAEDEPASTDPSWRSTARPPAKP